MDRTEIIQKALSFYTNPDWTSLEEALENIRSAEGSVNLSMYSSLEKVNEIKEEIKNLIPSLDQGDSLEKVLVLVPSLAQALRSLRISVLTAEAGKSSDLTQFLLKLEKLALLEPEHLTSCHSLLRDLLRSNN